MKNQRRDFLKITAAGAAGLALARADKVFAAWPTSGTLAVNPTIDNMRVVACVDTKMLKTALTSMTFAAENAAVDTARVQANMDAMAMQLANQTTADAAWKAIFRSSKAWNAQDMLPAAGSRSLVSQYGRTSDKRHSDRYPIVLH